MLTLPRLQDRKEAYTRELDGLNYEVFYGIDKEQVTLDALKQQGIYSSDAYADFYKRQPDMATGMLCCTLGHLKIYETIVANNYKKVMIMEDDIFPLPENLPFFSQMAEELPADWEVFYMGYEKNEIFGWKQYVKRMYYLTFPFHAAMRLPRDVFANYYPRPLSPHIARSGFHDCAHAYAVSLEGAKKLLKLQTPIVYNSDNLLSYAITTGQVKGYIGIPKMFKQHTNMYTIASLTDT